jgi:glycosyltransferase involved in cell wall biosynthesis
VPTELVALRPEGLNRLKRISWIFGTFVNLMPLRVLHIHSGNLYGGVETTLLAQARHRDPELGMEMSFALCFAGRFSLELAATSAPIFFLNSVRVRDPFSVRRARRRLKTVLEQQHFDIAVTHSCWSQAIFGRVVKEAGLPLVFWLHSAARGSHWLERWAKRTAPDLVLCNSKFSASTLANLYRSAESRVVYPPQSFLQTNLSGGNRAAIRSEFETSDAAVVIVQASRMESWKGHALHLAALSLLKDVPGWVSWQVGGAQRPAELRYLSKLRDLAAKLGIADRVRFVGERSDVQNVLEAADIYCQPNTSPEPFGLAFVEALWARLPVVTTAMGGAREIVDDSCGFLTEPAPQGLTTCLRRLIQDDQLRISMRDAGRARARYLCDTPRQLNMLQQIFTRLALGDRA